LLWVAVGVATALLALLLVRSPAIRYRVLGVVLTRYLIPSYVADCRSSNALQRAQALRMIVTLRHGLSDRSVERAQDLLLDGLQDPSADVRLAAAEAAGDFELIHAAPQLQRLLADGRQSIPLRSAAARALGQIGTRSAVDSLLVALRSEDPSLQRAAQAALVRTGSIAVAPTAALLHSSDTEVQGEAAQALAQLGAPAVPPLTTQLHSTDDDQAVLASTTLSEIGGPAITALADTLAQAPSARTRQLAASTLGRIVEQQQSGALCAAYGVRCRPALQRAAARDRAPQVRRTAVTALGIIGQLCRDTPATLACITALSDPSIEVSQEAEHSLTAMGDLAAEALRDELKRLGAHAPKRAPDDNDVTQLIAEYRDRRMQ